MMTLPLPVSVLRNATLADGSQVDVDLAGGMVSAVGPARPDRDAGAPRPAGELDLAGFVLLPSTADPHAHLDKALLLGRDPPADGRPACSAIDVLARATPRR